VKCPNCEKINRRHDGQTTLDTKLRENGTIRKRWKVCHNCGHRYTTIETIRVDAVEKRLESWPEPQKGQMVLVLTEVLKLVNSMLELDGIIKEFRKKENAWDLEKRDRVNIDKGFREGYKRGFEKGHEEG